MTERDTHDGETLTPAEAFAAVSNETRVAILQALAERHRTTTFSELRAAVGMKDSAQFNYHLKQLQPQFVTKVEPDGETPGGYRLRYAGREVVRAIMVGTFTTDVTRAPFPIDGECVSCGEGLSAEYAEEMLSITCGTCERLHSKMAFPASGLAGRSDAELLAAYDRWVRAEYSLVSAGVCPNCGGPMGAELVAPENVPGYACPKTGDPDDSGEASDGFDVGVRHHCEQCDTGLGAAVGMSLLDDTEVVAFYRDHGIDLEEVHYWDLPWTVSDRYTTVESEAPWRIVLAIPLDEEVLRLTLDGALTVLNCERTSTAAGAESEAQV